MLQQVFCVSARFRMRPRSRSAKRRVRSAAPSASLALQTFNFKRPMMHEAAHEAALRGFALRPPRRDCIDYFVYSFSEFHSFMASHVPSPLSPPDHSMRAVDASPHATAGLHLHLRPCERTQQASGKTASHAVLTAPLREPLLRPITAQQHKHTHTHVGAEAPCASASQLHSPPHTHSVPSLPAATSLIGVPALPECTQC